MWRQNQPRRQDRTGTWKFERWTDVPVAIPASVRGPQRSPFVQFLQRLGRQDPLLQRWSTHCLEHVVHLMTVDTPDRQAVVQSAACLQTLHLGIHKYRTGTYPLSAPAQRVSERSLDLLFQQPVFLRFPTAEGEEGLMVNHFSRGELYQVEMGTSLTYQIQTDRPMVWIAELSPSGGVRIHDLPPEEFKHELDLPSRLAGGLGHCRRPLRSLLHSLAP